MHANPRRPHVNHKELQERSEKGGNIPCHTSFETGLVSPFEKPTYLRVTAAVIAHHRLDHNVNTFDAEPLA